MKKVELLAPAGSMNVLKAVIEAGCDAVYLGGYQFGARSYAHNFSNEEIKEAIQYAHLYGVKVYVTVNTIIYEEEMTSCMQYIDFLHKNNVDAILIQDIGLLDLVRHTYPNLEVHASTQMHIHNLEGVKLMEELGVKRVVLARETPLSLIEEIQKNTKVELEVFVHGALCFSYAGQCLISSLIGGRSGNKGSCAGSCRQPYTLVGDRQVSGYLLSMRDLNTLEDLEKLLKQNVASLKIEGRTKREEYAYWVVKIYRKAIDSYYEKGKIEITEEEIRIMKELFNRDFTKGFLFSSKQEDLTNPYRPNHMGVLLGKVTQSKEKKVTISLKENLSVQDGIRFLLEKEDYGCIVQKMKVKNQFVNNAKKGDLVELFLEKKVPIGTQVVKTTNTQDLKRIRNEIEHPTRKVKIKGICTLKANEPILFQITDGKNEVIVTSNSHPEIPIEQETEEKRIIEQLSKLGDTIYEFSSLSLEKTEPLFVPIKVLNEVRREAIQKLNQMRMYSIPYQKEQYIIDVPDNPKQEKRMIWIQNQTQYNRIKKKDFSYIFVDNRPLFEQLKQDKRVIYRLKNVLEHHPTYDEPLLVSELGSVHKYKDFQTDTNLNVVNSYAVAFLHRMGAKIVTLSHELNDTQIENIITSYKNRYHKNPNCALVIYGREIVMTSKVNLNKIYRMHSTVLKDRFSNIYPIRVLEDLTYIYNYQLRNKDEKKYFAMGISYVRYDILYDEECK